MCWFMKMFRCYWLMSCWSRKFGCENGALHHAHTTKLSWYPLGNSTGQRHEEAFKVTNSSKAYPFLTPDPHMKYLYSRLLELGNSVTSAPTRLSQVYSSYLHYRQLNLTHKTQWTNQHLHSLQINFPPPYYLAVSCALGTAFFCLWVPTHFPRLLPGHLRASNGNLHRAIHL